MPNSRYVKRASKLRRFVELPVIGIGAFVFFFVFLGAVLFSFIVYRDV
jgi:hypothetical protein